MIDEKRTKESDYENEEESEEYTNIKRNKLEERKIGIDALKHDGFVLMSYSMSGGGAKYGKRNNGYMIGKIGEEKKELENARVLVDFPDFIEVKRRLIGTDKAMYYVYQTGADGKKELVDVSSFPQKINLNR